MIFPEQFRHIHPFIPYIPNDPEGGFFRIPHPELRDHFLSVIAWQGREWEHAAVTVHPYKIRPGRSCTWEEMSFIKSLFWEDDQTVMQLHPMKSEYVNNHPHCLHLWKPANQEIPLPPSLLVGVRNLNV
jgi:hypothetical protein